MGAFSKEARTQCDILQAMAKKMEELYGQLSEYLVFDRQKYTLEEFMGDIKTFKDQYKVKFVIKVIVQFNSGFLTPFRPSCQY